MPSARPESIGLQLTTGLWVSATFSCSGMGQGFCYGHPGGIRLIAILAQAKLELQRAGHELNDVSNHNLLGYDLECRGHCEAVFEIKGMGQPRDVEVPVSETAAAQNHGEDFHLVFIYNIPSTPNNIGCKIVRNPAGRSLLEPLERSKITSDKWMNAGL